MSRRKSTTKRRSRKRRRKPPVTTAARLGKLLVIALAAVLFLSIAAVGALFLVYPGQAMDGPSRSFEFAMADDLAQVAAGLEREKVIARADVFAAYVRLVADPSSLREGVVLLARDLTPKEVLRRVVLGRGTVPHRFVVREGRSRFEIAQRLESANICGASEFLAATAAPPAGVDAPSQEGYLFPDTYEFREGTPADDVAERMRDNYEVRTEPLFLRHTASLRALHTELGFDRHAVLILASIVEKEVARASERPIVAGVFLNRLRSESFRPLHRLQADPTVSYGCVAERARAESCAEFERRISRAMLNDSDNRYNTYRHGELPPGPIANPGLDSIEAVLNPETHDYLYFVARGGGRHAFAADLDTHNANVQRYMH